MCIGRLAEPIATFFAARRRAACRRTSRRRRARRVAVAAFQLPPSMQRALALAERDRGLGVVARVERVALAEVALVRPLLELLRATRGCPACRTSRRPSGRSSRGRPGPACRRPGSCPRGGSRRTGPCCRARSPARRRAATPCSFGSAASKSSNVFSDAGSTPGRVELRLVREHAGRLAGLGDAPERALAERLAVVGPLELLQRLRRVGLCPSRRPWRTRRAAGSAPPSRARRRPGSPGCRRTRPAGCRSRRRAWPA